MNRTNRRAGAVVRALLGLSILVAVLPGAALAQEEVDCETVLVQAEEQYNVGQFDVVIGRINACLEQGAIPEEDLPKAHRMLSHCYLGKQLADQAREAIRKLLELAPNYQPDPIQDLPAFTELIEEMKAEMDTEEDPPQLVVRQDPPETEREGAPPVVVPTKQKRSGGTRWLVIGGAAVAAGVLAAVLAGGGGGGNGDGPPNTPPPTGPGALPMPPALPGGN